MKPIYKHRNINFRNSAWPFSSGSVVSVFPKSKSDFKAGEFIEYLAYVLDMTERPYYSNNVFTISNVSSERYSYGFIDNPFSLIKNISNKGKLHLTFSLTTSEDLKGKVYHRHFGSGIYIYGDRNNQNKFLTISLDIKELRYYNFQYVTLSDLSYIYNIVGISSRNLVRFRHWKTPTTLNDYVDKENLLNDTVQSVFSKSSFLDWVYNRSIWVQAQNLISSLHLNPVSILYFCNNFLNVELEKSTKDRLYPDIIRTLQSGHTKLLSSIGNIPYSRLDVLAVVSLILRNKGVDIIDIKNIPVSSVSKKDLKDFSSILLKYF